MRHRLTPAILLALALSLAPALVACGGEDAAAPPSTLFAPDTSAPPTTTVAPVTTTTSTLPLPRLLDDGTARALLTPSGIPAAVRDAALAGGWVVVTPCGNEAVVSTGVPLVDAHVVLDPGHGGSEPGAEGEGGLVEKDLNLLVAWEVAALLEAEGVTVVLTRPSDYRTTLASRAAIATALGADAFVSIHHNADPDGPSDRPGTETYYQIDDPSSKRLAGLVYEELLAAFSAYDVDWVADTDAGAKYRLNQRGSDYYGILRESAGVPAVLVEAAFLSNPAEEALLATPEFRTVEAQAIARGVLRYLTTQDPGSGFVEPYERVQPAGPGGGADGCVDPPLE
jgi:N-acetylmuramoyl-L-alanine amidase